MIHLDLDNNVVFPIMQTEPQWISSDANVDEFVCLDFLCFTLEYNSEMNFGMLMPHFRCSRQKLIKTTKEICEAGGTTS